MALVDDEFLPLEEAPGVHQLCLAARDHDHGALLVQSPNERGLGDLQQAAACMQGLVRAPEIQQDKRLSELRFFFRQVPRVCVQCRLHA